MTRKAWILLSKSIIVNDGGEERISGRCRWYLCKVGAVDLSHSSWRASGGGKMRGIERHDLRERYKITGFAVHARHAHCLETSPLLLLTSMTFS